jgi:hypothetical protein
MRKQGNSHLQNPKGQCLVNTTQVDFFLCVEGNIRNFHKENMKTELESKLNFRDGKHSSDGRVPRCEALSSNTRTTKTNKQLKFQARKGDAHL